MYINSQQCSLPFLPFIRCITTSNLGLQTDTRLLASRCLSLVLKLRTTEHVYLTSSSTLRLNQVPTQQLTKILTNKLGAWGGVVVKALSY